MSAHPAPNFTGLDDETFLAVWGAADNTLRGLYPPGFARYQELVPYREWDQDQATARKSNGANGNGHEYNTPVEWVDDPHAGSPDEPPLTVTIRQPLDWPKLADSEPAARDWAIQGWIGMGHVTLLVGAGGIGKSLIAQQLASCVALGQNFIADIPRERKVLYWACEDDHDEIWRRQIQIAQWMQVNLAAYAPSLVIEPRHGLMNTMMSTEFGRPLLTPLINELAEQANDYAAELVIIDNAAQVYGGNENDRHSVTVFLNALAGKMPGKAILLLAHPSRGAGSEFSGSSAWENTARTRLYLGAQLPNEKPQDDDDSDTRFLCRRKANYSHKDYRRLMFADGVLKHDPAEGLDNMGNGRYRSAQVVLDAMAKLLGMGMHGTNGHTSPRYLPRLIIEYKLNDGVAVKDLTNAMREHMKSGRIKRAQIGKHSNRAPIEGLVLSA